MLDNNYRKCQEHIDKYLLKKKHMKTVETEKDNAEIICPVLIF